MSIGTQVKIFGTLPIGPGRVRAQVKLDDAAPVTIDLQCPSTDNIYNVVFWSASGIRAGPHTLVITNLGTAADFQLDSIEWYPTEADEAFRPLPAA